MTNTLLSCYTKKTKTLSASLCRTEKSPVCTGFLLGWWQEVNRRHAHSKHASSIAESEREGTRAETRIGLSAKRTSPFKSAGGSVQSTTGSRGVRISRQDYWLPTPFASFSFTSPPMRHRVPSHSDSALLQKSVPPSCCATTLKLSKMAGLQQRAVRWPRTGYDRQGCDRWRSS
jgi:hypothetical protein